MPIRVARSVRLTGAGRPFLPGCRPISHCRAGSTTAGARSNVGDIELALRGQDKHDRITFLPPKRFEFFNTKDARQLLISSFFPKAISMEPELLPFYLVDYMSDLRFHFRDKNADARHKAFNYRNTRYSTSYGLSVAAVPQGHWAHGVALKDDLEFFHDELGLPEERTAAIRDISESGMNSYFNFIPPQYDGATMLKFAYGPPRLFSGEQQKVANLQQSFSDMLERHGHDHVEEARELQRDMEYHFFPHYRLVYKVELADGRLGFVDASTPFTHSMFCFYPHEGTPSVIPHFAARGDGLSSRFFRTRFELREKQAWSRIEEGIKIVDTNVDEDRTSRFCDIVIDAMSRNVVKPQTWDDQQIFPLVGDGSNLDAVWEYVFSSLAGTTDVKAPKGFGATAIAPRVSGHLRARSAPSPPPLQKAEESEKPEFEQREEEIRKPQTSTNPFTSSRVTQRNTVLASRLRKVVHRQRAWQGATAASAAAATVVRVVDPKGYYRAMEISPRPDFIKPALEDRVNDELQKKYHELSRRYHPDLAATTPEEQIQMNRKMAEINNAYAEISLCEKRIRYHKSTI